MKLEILLRWNLGISENQLDGRRVLHVANPHSLNELTNIDVQLSPFRLLCSKVGFIFSIYEKKFERTTFCNAKIIGEKEGGELLLPSNSVAPIRSCPVDHFFVFVASFPTG